MNLLDHIKTILEQNESFCKDGRLFKNSVVEAALKLDPVLLKLLLADEKGKKYFFTDVDGIIVFDKVKFQKFVSNKEFLPDSFTAYKNKIGLTANGEYLTEANEVVLDFPYKDCVLEGGQTREDEKRQEIFWNETLAPDEIDRLFEPKVFINWKRYSVKGEEKVAKISKDDNLIIKGNNLLALHSLLPNYKGKVQLIYIDPPYNTGNDDFKYNDSFNHSTWLTFIRSRLLVAKFLLKETGNLFVQIDDNEVAYMKVLIDGVFGRDNVVSHIYWKRTFNTGSSKSLSNKLPANTDTILWISKSKNYLHNKQYRPYSEGALKRYDKKDKKGVFKWNPLKTYSQEKLDRLIKEGNAKWTESSKYPVYKHYLDESKGSALDNFWHDISSIGTFSTERTGFVTQKPETLIERIISLGSNKGDLILDFFSGSGTTAAVAHKMERQFIITEQMDYVQTITLKRLTEVIAGKQDGISEKVNWKGGGSFVYAELAQDNAGYINSIQAAKKSKALIKIWDEIKDKGFISYKVSPKDIDDSISEFSELSLDDQKKLLISLLDKNQLYVNYSDMEDADHKISKEDQGLNHQFYQS